MERVEKWLSDTAPGPDIILPDATAAGATSSATFLGDDWSDPAARGASIYTDPNNLPTALASILNRIQDRADFHPASMSPSQLAARFGNYATEIQASPFFDKINPDDVRGQSFNSKDFNVLFAQIVSCYEGLEAKDLGKLYASIANTARSVFGQSKSEAWVNLFAESTMDVRQPNLAKLMIYYTSLHMKHESGKSEVNEQSYSVRRTTYTVLVDRIKEAATNLAELDRKSVDDWLSDSTSPEDPNTQLCFEISEYDG